MRLNQEASVVAAAFFLAVLKATILIPETLRLTNLHAVQFDAGLNHEIDQTAQLLVDTLRRLLALSS